MTKYFDIIHISDLHYSCPAFQFKDIFNKRALGYLNEKFRRKSYQLDFRREQLLKAIAKKDYDLLCITGDLSSLSYRTEFAKAQTQLDKFLAKDNRIIIPGNHDRYLKSTTKKEIFESYFKKHTPFSWRNRKHQSIYTKTILGKFLLVFFDMAMPQYFSSRSILKAHFFSEYKKIIRSSENISKIKIGFGHYPLFLDTNQKESYWRKLQGAEKLANLLLEDSFIAYCHGHIHQNWQNKIKNGSNHLWAINSGGAILDNQPESRLYNKLKLYSSGKVEVKQLSF